MANLDSVSKSKDISLPTKVCIVKSMVFPVVMYGCESWTIKLSAEVLMLLNCWIRLLRVPWTTRRSNQLMRKEISPEYSLQGLLLKLKFQYFGRQMGSSLKGRLIERTLMLGKIEGRRKRGQQRMRWLDGIADSMDTTLVNSGSW